MDNNCQNGRKMIFTKKTPQEIIKSNKNGILNFQNLHSVYLFENEPIYKKEITSTDNYIFPDGKILSIFLRYKQIRGPTFTRYFFENELNIKQKHFFILPGAEYLNQLRQKFPKLNAEAYNPPYIKGTTFSKEDVSKIAKQLTKFKPDYVWVCIGNPKQEILANQLYRKYKTFYFNVGAAMDFLLGKKGEAPVFWRVLCLESFYRLITDFKYSKKKVWKSLIGLKYLTKVRLK